MMKTLIKENKLPPPAASREQFIAATLKLIPDNPVVDLIEGWYLADKMRWAEALPLLERGIAQSPSQLVTDDFIIKLWCTRFATLSAEQALQRPWYVAGGAVFNIGCGQQLLDADYLLDTQGIGNYHHRRYHTFLAPEESRILLNKHYLSTALKQADSFIETPFEYVAKTNQFSFYDSLTPKDYSQLCSQLADIYRQQQCHDKADFLERRSGAIDLFLDK